METNNKRLLHIDILRVISMFSVLFLHVVADLLRINYKQPVWHFSNVITTVMSTSVPLFFMISGALLLSSKKTLSIGNTYKKRLPKVVIPFLFWSMFAILYYFIIGYYYYGRELNFAPTFYRLSHLLSEPVTIHFWFMYALIPIYILSPLLKALVDNLNKNTTLYLICLWVVFSVCIPTLRSIVPVDYKIYFTLNSSYSLNLFSGYIGFFILGYYINNLKYKIRKKVLLIFILIDIIIVSVATYLYTNHIGAYFEGFKIYNGFFTASLSIAIFILIKDIYSTKELGTAGSRVLTLLSSTSFSIYLVHNLIIHFMSINYFIVPNLGIWNTILRVLFVFIASLLLTILLASIKTTCYPATGISYKDACESFNLQYFWKNIKK